MAPSPLFYGPGGQAGRASAGTHHQELAAARSGAQQANSAAAAASRAGGLGMVRLRPPRARGRPRGPTASETGSLERRDQREQSVCDADQGDQEGLLPGEGPSLPSLPSHPPLLTLGVAPAWGALLGTRCLRKQGTERPGKGGKQGICRAGPLRAAFREMLWLPLCTPALLPERPKRQDHPTGSSPGRIRCVELKTPGELVADSQTGASALHPHPSPAKRVFQIPARVRQDRQ